MRTPRVNLSSPAVIMGWILVVGGIVEAVDMLFHRHWVFRSFAVSFLHGPAVLISLGIALWLLARRS